MIIGITGTFAAGKDTVADYLKSKGFECFSLGDEVRQIAKERGVELTRDSQREMGNTIRDELGDDYLAKRVMQKAKSEKVAIAGIRQPGEIRFLKTQPDFYLIAVDAPIELRFERMSARHRTGDPENIEVLREKEEKEMRSEGKNAQKIGECMEMADFTVTNDGDIEKLQKEVDGVLEEIGSKKK